MQRDVYFARLALCLASLVSVLGDLRCVPVVVTVLCASSAVWRGETRGRAGRVTTARGGAGQNSRAGQW